MPLNINIASATKHDAPVSAAGDLPAYTGLKPDAVQMDGTEWDEKVCGFDGVCQEQLYRFAVKRWPGVSCEPLMISLPGKPDCAAVLVMIQPLPLRIGAIAVVKWGPMLADERAPDANRTYAAIINWLKRTYCDERGLMLSILPRAAIGTRTYEQEVLSDFGFRPGSQLLFPNRYVVNIRLDDDAQRQSFGQKWRYHLNKSLKQDLAFEHARVENLGEFDALYQTMTDRKKFPDHSAYDTVPMLMAMQNPALRPELFFVREAGEIVAGAIIFKAGASAVYLYGATNDRALPLRAGYFLHWHIIRWLRDNTNARWYDLGGTDGFQGLHQFKKGMAGTAGTIAPVPPMMNLATNFRARLFGELAFAAREISARLQRWRETHAASFAKPDQER